MEILSYLGRNFYYHFEYYILHNINENLQNDFRMKLVLLHTKLSNWMTHLVAILSNTVK